MAKHHSYPPIQIGQRYGRLTILREITRAKHGHRRWAARCDCGNESIPGDYALKVGRVVSCGCLNIEKMHQRFPSVVVGERFGRLTVIGEAPPTKDGHRCLYCRCDCGKITNPRETLLKHRKVLSCGCRPKIQRKFIGPKKPKKKHTAERRTWQNMRTRTTNPKSDHYADYGGRGIRVTFTSFQQFLSEVGPRPGPDFWIERLDTNGHYGPGNVAWKTATENMNNKRNNHRITYQGKTQTIMEWSRELHVPYERLKNRIYRGFTLDRVLSSNTYGKAPRVLAYQGKTQSAAEWVRELGIPDRKFRSKLEKGWSLEQIIDHFQASL